MYEVAVKVGVGVFVTANVEVGVKVGVGVFVTANVAVGVEVGAPLKVTTSCGAFAPDSREARLIAVELGSVMPKLKVPFPII